MEDDGEIERWRLCPVEIEPGDGDAGLKGDGQCRGDVGEGGLPFCGGGAVDGRDGVLTLLVRVWAGDAGTLREVVGDCFDGTRGAIENGEGPVGRKGVVVGCRCGADGYGDRMVCIGGVRGGVGCRQAGESRVRVVGVGADGPAVPVEGAVFELWNLGCECWVDVQDVVGHEAEAKIAEECDLVGTAVASEEGVGWVRAAVGGEVIN